METSSVVRTHTRGRSDAGEGAPRAVAVPGAPWLRRMEFAGLRRGPGREKQGGPMGQTRLLPISEQFGKLAAPAAELPVGVLRGAASAAAHGSSGAASAKPLRYALAALCRTKGRNACIQTRPGKRCASRQCQVEQRSAISQPSVPSRVPAARKSAHM